MKQEIESLLYDAMLELSVNEELPLDLNISIERPRDASHGDFSTNLAIKIAKAVGTSPRTLALKLISLIPAHADIANIDVAGAGFINFTLSSRRLLAEFEEAWSSPTCGVKEIANKSTIVIDYSSPNLAKEMHIGHLRSTIIGDALARVMALKGYKVIRQNHVGDWGTQFGMLLAHLNDVKQEGASPVALDNLEIFYKEAKLRFDSSPVFAQKARQMVVLLQSLDPYCIELWTMFIKLSLEHCHNLYRRLDVLLEPQDVKAESSYNSVLPEIIASLDRQKFLVECDGALCVFLDGFVGKDNLALPIIVKKGDGGFLYASTDLAAIHYRQTVLHAARVLYVVDARQSLHFQQIFTLAHKAGFAHDTMELEHISFGMVLDKTGKPYKSRDGGVTKLADLLDEALRRARLLILSKQSNYSTEELDNMVEVLAIAAIKYADLSKNRASNYVFDWDTMLSFEGNTAPYLLYAYTRIQSIFKKAEVNVDVLTGQLVLMDVYDTLLVKQLLLFTEVIEAVVVRSQPHLLCTYLYELAGVFSSFYESCPILNQGDLQLRTSRLKLAGLTSRILKLGLSLLGIKTLNRM